MSAFHPEPPGPAADAFDAPAPDSAAHAQAFFRDLQAALSRTCAATAPKPGGDGLSALMAQAFDSFHGNIAQQCEAEPPLACHRGCATCCTLRVVASAPEVLLVARFLKAVQPRLQQRGIDLIGRVRTADAATRGLNEAGRVALRQRCPFIAQGVCVVYGVRPLACRGHASHDVHACQEAAAGRRTEVPFSVGHHMLRALVQNALQSALHEHGLAWGLYELNYALLLALDHPDAEAAWRAGEDVLAAAALHEVPAEEMAAAYERLKAPA